MKNEVEAVGFSLRSKMFTLGGIKASVTLLLLLSSCTYYIPAKLETSRVGDTLSVALDAVGAARWDPMKDSLVVECNGCEAGRSREVEHFEERPETQYDIANTRGLTLVLYSMGHRDTTLIPGDAVVVGATPELRPIVSRRHRPASMEEKAAAAPKAPVEKTVKKTTSLKVTAAEGVAIYKDKTKKEVLKILPKGSTIILLGREGDLYSVSVDGEEGFVDAEAVQVQE